MTTVDDGPEGRLAAVVDRLSVVCKVSTTVTDLPAVKRGGVSCTSKRGVVGSRRKGWEEQKDNDELSPFIYHWNTNPVDTVKNLIIFSKIFLCKSRTEIVIFSVANLVNLRKVRWWPAGRPVMEIEKHPVHLPGRPESGHMGRTLGRKREAMGKDALNVF